MNYGMFSSAFLHERYSLWYSTESWKYFSLFPFCAFFNFANHVYRKVITNDILWIKIYSFECSSPLKIQFYKNIAILFVVILIQLIHNHLREGNMYVSKVLWRLNVTKCSLTAVLFGLYQLLRVTATIILGATVSGL